ncbi:hypothetical protein BDZ89DRAFT_1084775 [Hymenopellis radicata]|nr:hypothetical protein BDZ89DRAFT_1084775 [Hymenopellis radicata]
MLSEHSELISLSDLPRPVSLTTPLGACDAPSEILQHIFVLDAESYRGFELRPGAKHPALRLAHVSRAWRAAALGTSVLWSRLEVDVSSSEFSWPYQTGDYANGHAASSWRWRSALNQFLILAQNFPLCISLMFSGSLLRGHDEEIQDIVSSLLDTAPRWKSLSLVFRPDCDGGDWSFLDPLHDRLDSLERLGVLVFQFGHGRPLSLSRCTAFRDAPKLTKVSIIPENRILVELPWSQLLCANLNVNGAGDRALMVHDFVVGLQKADQLKALVCREFYKDFDVPVLDQPIVVELPRLEEITLFASSQLGHWLVLPSLSKLRVFESQPDSKDNPVLSSHFIQSLVARSKCNIISLTIFNALASRTLDGLQNIAHHLPQLVSFQLEQDLRREEYGSLYNADRREFRWNVSMGVFSFLTRPPTTDSPFSLLQNLSLLTRVGQSVDPDDVFGIFPSLSVMLASRDRPDLAAAHQKLLNRGRVQGPYQRFSKVEDDARWQTLAGEYRGQINVLIEVIDTTSMYDYQIWLGRTPEPERFWSET